MNQYLHLRYKVDHFKGCHSSKKQRQMIPKLLKEDTIEIRGFIQTILGILSYCREIAIIYFAYCELKATV